MSALQAWVTRGLLVASLVDPVVTLDRGARDALQSVRGGALERVMHVASDVGNPRNFFGALVVVAVAGGPAGPVIVREAVVALVPANLVVEGLKRAVNRTRPDGSHDPANASFPSSHAANAAVVAYLVTRRWRGAGWVAWPAAALVALSRMWLDRHYLSDVVVGAGIGVAATWWAARWSRGAGRAWIETGRYRSG